MEKVKIKAQIREKTGSRESRKLRKRGFITGEIYGHNEKNLHICIEQGDFERIWRRLHGETVIYEIEANGKTYKTLIKEIQRDVIKGHPIHIDFQILHEKEEIVAPVPVIIKGTPKGVKRGGIFEHILHEVHVSAIPSKMPGHIEVDVSELDIGDSVHIEDLKLPKGVKIKEDPDRTICTVIPPRKVEEIKEEVPVEEAAPAEVEEEKKEEKKEEK
jgi:large subunit ribosomal protein L25